MAREGRGSKNTNITKPPESNFYKYCSESDEEINIFEWEPVEDIIHERIEQFRKEAASIKLLVKINELEKMTVLIEDDGDEVEYELSDIAIFSHDNKRNEYCLDMIEYPELLKPVEKQLHDQYANTIQIAKDPRKKKLFCRQPKITTQVRKSRINSLKSKRNFCQMEVSKILQAMVVNMEADIKEDDDLRTSKDTPHFVKEVKAFTKYYKDKRGARKRVN